MSLLNFLSLDDEAIDIVTTVTRDWCHLHQVCLDSERGRQAMAEAIGLVIQAERWEVILADKLSREMRIQQYQHPIE
jgi:hypothetical protein